jgi:L,D-transpeptidase-like protein/putative peptidoglycan binding protein
MLTKTKFSAMVLLTLAVLIIPTYSSAHTIPNRSSLGAEKLAKKRPAKRALTRAEVREAELRLSEMGYGAGRIDGLIDGTTQKALVTFQKWEGRKITGRLSRSEFEAIMSASTPQPKDSGYKHVEVDLDRQVLLLTNDEGAVERILPVSTGSNRHYREKKISGLAYTPRGRFRIYAKISGWRKSPLGLLYYPNYFSDGLAIHGNPSVPHSPESHGCVRIPMSAAAEMSRLLPVGTILLIYDKQSFVSAKDWAEEDRQKQEAKIR